MILIIDNYDSFTYNLYQQIAGLGFSVQVIAQDKITLGQIAKLNPKKIIISPGPGNPETAGISMAVIKKFYKIKPILGVCLGHQCIGQVFSAKIIGAKSIIHGKTSLIYHDHKSVFYGLRSPLKVARYHSLAINCVPENFNLLAWTRDKEIMAIGHQKYPLIGVQFHPESFLTEKGNIIMKNFLYAKK
ncbi:MAG: aminodeoxychorismate/anthranilate synthase component II [Patescibacteria group bacterium]